VTGLYNGLFVMRDDQTGSVWTHYDGTVLTGALENTGIQLEMGQVIHTTWAEWTALHPETTVLDWYPEFADQYRENMQPGRSGLGPSLQKSVLNWDERLPENELVLGVNIGEQYRAYPLADFGDELMVVHDSLADEPLVVFIDHSTLTGLAFSPEVNGALVTLTADSGTITDDRGNIWDLSGEAISGPDIGAQLSFVTSFVTEWYGWAAYHPQTTIYGQRE
jgi:hypothetical protein